MHRGFQEEIASIAAKLGRTRTPKAQALGNLGQYETVEFKEATLAAYIEAESIMQKAVDGTASRRNAIHFGFHFRDELQIARCLYAKCQALKNFIE